MTFYLLPDPLVARIHVETVTVDGESRESLRTRSREGIRVGSRGTSRQEPAKRGVKSVPLANGVQRSLFGAMLTAMIVVVVARTDAIASPSPQAIDVQPALNPGRQLRVVMPEPQAPATVTEWTPAREELIYWLITSDGDRRPIRQFAVDGETLIVWPRIDPAVTVTTSSASGRDARSDGAPSVDQDRITQQIPLDTCVAILADQPIRATAAGPRAAPAVELVDGQRFPGEPRTTATPMIWMHPWIGSQLIDLERVRAIVFQPGAVTTRDGVPPEPGAEDMVLLANGDRVDGIIAELGAEVTVERAGDQAATGSATSIPIGRIAALTLITPIEPPIGPRLWFDDGTIIDAIPTSSDTAKPGLVAIRRVAGVAPSAPATTAERTPLVESSSIRAFATSPKSLMPLAALSGFEARSTSELPTITAPRPRILSERWPARIAPIVIGGATALRYTLPNGEGRFVAEARPEGVNPRWTSFTLVVRSGEVEVFRRDIAPDTTTGTIDRSAVWINVPITSRTLEIEVLEGERGPISDGVRLDYAMILTPDSATKESPADLKKEARKSS